MGPGLRDPIGEGDATPNEWRTPPLWGSASSSGFDGFRHPNRQQIRAYARIRWAATAARIRVYAGDLADAAEVSCGAIEASERLWSQVTGRSLGS